MTERNLLFDSGWLDGYRDLHANDRLTAKRVRAAVNSLIRDPEPPGSTNLSGSLFHRLDSDDYRVLYEVTEDTIRIWSLGRAPR